MNLFFSIVVLALLAFSAIAYIPTELMAQTITDSTFVSSQLVKNADNSMSIITSSSGGTTARVEGSTIPLKNIDEPDWTTYYTYQNFQNASISCAHHLETDGVGVGSTDCVSVYSIAMSGVGSTVVVNGFSRDQQLYYKVPLNFVFKTIDVPVIQMADDGSIVSLEVCDSQVLTCMATILDGQTGDILFQKQFSATAQEKSEVQQIGKTGHEGNSVGANADGTFASFTMWGNMYVYEINSTDGSIAYRGDPSQYPIVQNENGTRIVVIADLCPRGNYLNFGYNIAFTFGFHTDTNLYQEDYSWTISVQPSIVVRVTSTKNGGGSNIDGCLVSYGWQSKDTLTSYYSVHSMLNGKTYYEVQTGFSVNRNDNRISSVRMHMTYQLVTTWGNGGGASTIVVYDLYSTIPVWEITTPGSMVQGDLYLDGNELYVSAAGMNDSEASHPAGGSSYAYKLILTVI